MNSDPYDSAAWRTLGMLDAEESASFDEAMLHDPALRNAYLEMERLSAAIATASSTPIEPKAGQLERLQMRLGLGRSNRRHLGLAISGWAAAAVLAIMLVIDHTGALHSKQPMASAASHDAPVSTHHTDAPSPRGQLPAPGQNTSTPPPSSRDALANAPTVDIESVTKSAVQTETKRLVQEIEVLRNHLEKYQQRDRALFEPVPGMALPIIMRMSPPDTASADNNAIAANDNQSPVALLLADTMRISQETNTAGNSATASDAPPLLSADSTTPSADATTSETPSPQDPAKPSAIPIYDSARDAGTIVLNNLPSASDGNVYNLWVTTLGGDKPIYVGRLPDVANAQSMTFDFNLGTNRVIPSSFTLTQDPAQHPSTPSKGNTVLQGPAASAK